MRNNPGLGDAGSSLASTALGGGISAAVGLATGAASLWLNSINLSHQADTATTQIVNGMAPKLQAIKDAYLAGPGTCQDQAAAMSAYLTLVNFLFSAQGCGNGAYGSAGNRCISDRFGPGGPTDTNAQFPWAAYYYWPIANNPRASGCAASALAANPDAALDSAIQNALNAASGNAMQTTPGQFAAGTGGGTVGSVVSAAGFSFTDMFGPLPIWAWAAAVLGLIVVLKK